MPHASQLQAQALVQQCEYAVAEAKIACPLLESVCISLCTLHPALHWRVKQAECRLTNVFACCGLQTWSDDYARQGRLLVVPHDFPQQQASCLSYPHFVCAGDQKAFATSSTQLFGALANGTSSMQTCLQHQKCASPCRSAKHTALHISDSSQRTHTTAAFLFAEESAGQ